MQVLKAAAKRPNTVQRWSVGAGGFIGEVTLFTMNEFDSYIQGNDTRTYVMLSNLHVHPLRRGKGWATLLISAALKHAEERGWCVYLRTVPFNNSPFTAESLGELYARYGFKKNKHGDMVLRWSKNTRAK